QIGRFELADDGTIFLEEIGELPLELQGKLLRIIRDGELERLGSPRTIRVDVRIIASSSRDLEREVRCGRFREDLFYRLNVFPIELPPLAQRREAILPLAEYFREKFSAAFGKRVTGFSEEAGSALRDYGWPGNVRELQNVIERAVILSGGSVEAEHLNLEPLALPSSPPGGILRETEREAIRNVLSDVGGNRKNAARILGISLRTLQYRIKEYGL
ncbi:MAG TPA: sigma-54-dependent Fis family transcriptional regulator, partial [Deltaproteobacteria bacterium]|nr:sigma-54-dependent Fis family transcriptional regulator [Deltaproteobacteria bacterium]